jgi:hypothetical protein
MGLKYMGIADSIIELAFGALVVGGAAAAALAYGLGGRDAAARQRAPSRRSQALEVVSGTSSPPGAPRAHHPLLLGFAALSGFIGRPAGSLAVWPAANHAVTAPASTPGPSPPRTPFAGLNSPPGSDPATAVTRHRRRLVFPCRVTVTAASGLRPARQEKAVSVSIATLQRRSHTRRVRRSRDHRRRITNREVCHDHPSPGTRRLPHPPP